MRAQVVRSQAQSGRRFQKLTSRVDVSFAQYRWTSKRITACKRIRWPKARNHNPVLAFLGTKTVQDTVDVSLDFYAILGVNAVVSRDGLYRAYER